MEPEIPDQFLRSAERPNRFQVTGTMRSVRGWHGFTALFYAKDLDAAQAIRHQLHGCRVSDVKSKPASPPKPQPVKAKYG